MISILNFYDWRPIDAVPLIVDGLLPVDYLNKELRLWRRRLILCAQDAGPV
jgi:hypothetical protein